MEWDTVIGLEVHAQLNTVSKLFSGAATAFGATPNTQTAFIDAGLPGVLPVLNEQAVRMAILFGLAVDADILDGCIFERKNYFYPDLPKGYQISQFQKPLVRNGTLAILLPDGSTKDIAIERAHLEEDAGKSAHDIHQDFTSIDLNRAGMPLLEIVTTPCMFSAVEAVSYLKTLHQLLRFLEICDGNMQEGSFRCDVNISLKPKGTSPLGTRTELKNLNSFRYIEKAIAVEVARQQDILEQGHTLRQETRLYHPEKQATFAMREKEFDKDYRYFPDPDLLPVQVTRYLIAEIQQIMPKLPQGIYQALKNIPSLTEEDMQFILSAPAIYHYYQAVQNASPGHEKLLINWLKGPYAAALNENKLSFENAPVPAETLAQFLNKIADKTISTHLAKTIFTKLWHNEGTVESLIQNLQDEPGEAYDLTQLINDLLVLYPQQVAEYKAGKEKLLSFFVGHLMKQTQGKVNPEQASAALKRIL